MSLALVPSDPEPEALQDKALDDLGYIRSAIERAGSFTAVPGWGGVAMGVVAIIAGLIAGRADTQAAWLRAWLAAAPIAFAICCAAIAIKARRIETRLVRGPALRFLLTLAPPLAAGAVLTASLAGSARYDLLPGVWLLLYGTAVTTGARRRSASCRSWGSASWPWASRARRPRLLGQSASHGGFGGLQIAFGLVIARRHGG